jgi:DNA repair exonuclease SbcCD ATPase subunit
MFKVLRWKNFLSTGDQFIEIKLNEHHATLILGENGSGKSTIEDALSFVLFSKPFRNINKPQLINSLNQNECLVEIEFSIGKNEYFIRRGQKPSIFEIYVNGKMLDQDSRIKDYQSYLEQNILKLNYKSFCQVVVLGSSTFVPFMQLKAADRRFIIEDLLDIQIFSSMNNILKQRMIDLKDNFQKIESQIELINEKITLRRKYLEELKENVQSQIKTNKFKIRDNQKEKRCKFKEIEELEQEIESLSKKIEEEDVVRNRIRKLQSIEEQLNSTNKKIEKDILFYGDTETCPTCKQNINEVFKQKVLKTKISKQKEIVNGLKKIELDLFENNKKLTKILDIIGSIRAKQRDLSKLNSTICAIDSFIEKIQEELVGLQSKKEPSREDKCELEILEKERLECLKNRETLIGEKYNYGVVALMLKDSGIKTTIIEKYLPIINKLVNKYLSDLDFFVNFNLDKNFKEVIKSRGCDEFSYESFSEGEKLRIDLSLLFTWREISKRKNSANTNLLILDEIFDSSLDSNGTEDFLKLIGSLHTGINIFIISHKGDSLQDKFSNTIRFTKVKNFSIVKQND